MDFIKKYEEIIKKGDTKEEKEFLQEEYEILSKIIKDQKNECKNRLEEAISNVKYEQYSSFSSEHRGYYCPSLINDIVVGNTNRGKLYKTRKKDHIGYTYGFDTDKRLILIKKKSKDISAAHYEYLFPLGEDEVGIGLDDCSSSSDLEISHVSLCHFENGKLDTYLYGHNFYYDNFGIQEINKEKYYYSKDKLIVERQSKYIALKGKKRLICCNEKLIFDLKNGELDSYVVQYFDETGNLQPNSPQYVFNSHIKRNIYEKDPLENIFYLKQ